MIISGFDAEFPPQPTPGGFDIAGVYVAGPLAPYGVWTQDQVKALDGKVKGVLPIAGPPQEWPWSQGADAVLEGMVTEAKGWGVPRGSALCMDMEEGLAEKIGGDLNFVLMQWRTYCTVAGYIPWVYGSNATLIVCPPTIKRWLGEWPSPTPTDPSCPPGLAAWQYRGGETGFDLSTFASGNVFMRPNLQGVITVTDTAPVPQPDPDPTPAPAAWIAEGTGYYAVVSADLSSKRVLATPAEGQALVSAGYKVLAVPAEFVDRIPADNNATPAAPSTPAPSPPPPASDCGALVAAVAADPQALAAFMSAVQTGAITLPAIEDPLAAKPHVPALTDEEKAGIAAGTIG